MRRKKEPQRSAPAPTCALCKQPVGAVYVDGATMLGPWATMCSLCFIKAGVGLGVGLGQLHRTSDGLQLAGGYGATQHEALAELASQTRDMFDRMDRTERDERVYTAELWLREDRWA